MSKLKLLIFVILVSLASLTFGIESNSNAEKNRFVVLTVRKSGTHLIQKCIALLTGKTPNYKHFIFAKESQLQSLYSKKDCKILVTLRDPRDLLVSSVFYRMERFKILSEDGTNNIPREDLRRGGLAKSHLDKWEAATFDERLMIAIKSTWPLPFGKILTEYDYLRYFSQRKNTLLIRYEDLIGETGGGDNLEQKKAIERIARFIGEPTATEKIDYVRNNVFGASKTFRKGEIGTWKQYFKREHVELFLKKMGHLLIEWGYEQDDSWADEFLKGKEE